MQCAVSPGGAGSMWVAVVLRLKHIVHVAHCRRHHVLEQLLGHRIRHESADDDLTRIRHQLAAEDVPNVEHMPVYRLIAAGVTGR